VQTEAGECTTQIQDALSFVVKVLNVLGLLDYVKVRDSSVLPEVAEAIP